MSGSSRRPEAGSDYGPFLGAQTGRDGAEAVLKALELDTTGFERFIIGAADTVMSRSNAELVAEVFSEVPVARDLGNMTRWCRSTKFAACSDTARSTPVVDPPIDPFNG